MSNPNASSSGLISTPASGLPQPQGLYHPSHEHDACGIGFVANIKGEKSHEIIEKGIQILIALTHRGLLAVAIRRRVMARVC